jgi:cobalt-zinc-cadmium efflux system outer membrane protein
VRLRRALLSAEKAARIPDVEAAVGLKHFEGDGTDAMIFGVGMPLPLFDRNQGNMASAEHELLVAQSERAPARQLWRRLRAA